MIACAQQAVSQTNKPNVVLIVSDDQGWGDYSFMGHKQIKTPHLDKLASQSLVYKRGYVPSSLCCPSLASILTGKYPHESKITGNEPPVPMGKPMAQRYKDPEFLTQVNRVTSFMENSPRLPAELGKVGYNSFQTGKWWQGNFKTGGFTHGMSHGDQTLGGRHGDEGLNIGRKGLQPIFDFIETSKDKPFFYGTHPCCHTLPITLLKNIWPSIKIKHHRFILPDIGPCVNGLMKLVANFLAISTKKASQKILSLFMSPTTVGSNRKETPNTERIQNSLLMMADYARPSCSDIQAKLNRK